MTYDDEIRAIRAMRDQAGRSELEGLLAKTGNAHASVVRHEALDALAMVATRIRLDASELEPGRAAAAMEILSGEPFVGAALDLLKEDDGELRRGAARLIAALRVPSTRAALEGCVESGADPQLRQIVERGLAAWPEAPAR